MQIYHCHSLWLAQPFSQFILSIPLHLMLYWVNLKGGLVHEAPVMWDSEEGSIVRNLTLLYKRLFL